MSPAQGCKAVRELDEFYCHDCGLRWDVKDDDPPPCGSGWTTEAKLLLFRMMRGAEMAGQHLSKFMKKNVAAEYATWMAQQQVKAERAADYGQEDRTETEGE